MTRKILLSATLATVLLLGASPGARAGGADKAASRKSFERAELLYRQARFRQALAAYKKAMSFYRHPAYLFNIAQCHRQLREYTKARFYYKLFLSESADTPNRAEVERFIGTMELKIAERSRLERQKGRLSVVTDPPGADIYINEVRGKPLGRTPAVIRLAPGQQIVVLRAAGFQTIQREVTIRPGAVVSLKEVLRRPIPRPALGTGPTAAPKPGKPYHQRWWFWTGLTVAVAAIGVASYTGTQALRIQSIWDENQGAPADDPNLLRRGKIYRTMTDVLIGVAAVSAGAAIIGAILVARNNRRARERASATVVPSCGPGGCGIWVSGRF